MERDPTSRTVAATAMLFVLAVLAAFPFRAFAEDELVALARNNNCAVIADFGLGLCKQCKAQSAILDKVRAAYKDKVIVRMVHVNKEHELTARYGVELIPHLVFLDRAGRIALRKSGVMKYEEIVAQLSRMGIAP